MVQVQIIAVSPTVRQGSKTHFEQGVFENAFNTAECLNHVSAVVVQVPQLAIVALVSPPERILQERQAAERTTKMSKRPRTQKRSPTNLSEDLIFLPLGADAPALVVGQSVAILLEQRVDARQASIPAVLQIFQRQTTILHNCSSSKQATT